MIKRLISILLVLSVLLVWVPTSVVAANPDQNIFGAGTSWTLSGGTLTISGSGAVEFNTKRDSAWIKGITAVVIKDGITEIKERTFENFENVTKVTIPSTVTSICYSAFENCKSLTSVSIPAGVKSIEKETFAGCSKLTGVAIPSSVTSIGNSAFKSCVGLSKIIIPASVKTIGTKAFMGCSGLTNVVLYNGVTSIGSSAFKDCSGLPSISIPNSVEVIGDSAFSGCTGLNSLILPNSVRHIGDMAFMDCTSLGSVLLPDGVTSICYSAFENCTSLTGVTMPDSIASIGESAFAGCRNLANVYYSGDQSTWTEIDILEDNDELLNAAIHYNLVRLAGTDRYATAFAAAEELKKLLNVEKFENIVVASGADYPDALAGSYLANQKNAPILLVKGEKELEIKQYIEENLVSGGTVYLLGGTGAVSETMESSLSGFNVKRLGGLNRYATNLAILKEAGVEDKDILVAYGLGFADSLSASAVNLPILLVGQSLTDEQKEFLDETNGEKIIIGGIGAVNETIEAELKEHGTGEVSRLSGSDRYETSVLVAERFFTDVDQVVIAYGGTFPDGLCAGPVANAIGEPLILAALWHEDDAAEYISEGNVSGRYIIGGTGVLSDKTVNKVFGLQ